MDALVGQFKRWSFHGENIYGAGPLKRRKRLAEDHGQVNWPEA